MAKANSTPRLVREDDSISSSISETQAKLLRASAIVDLIYCLNIAEGIDELDKETLSWALGSVTDFLNDAHVMLMPKGGAE
ncbi:MAG: hypothetical protein HY847_11890 [Betaproteobacteria bacterium]|nr:hypothetical protein [Betaproteobacteria bacterium]